MTVPQTRKRNAAVADPTAREFLRGADPILRELIDAHPGFRPRAWLNELPPRDAFGSPVFGVIGQQLSVRATRVIVSRLEQLFGGHLPSAEELLAVDPEELRAAGMSHRKAATLRVLAERFADGRLSEKAFAPACRSASLRIRPPSNRRRDGRGGGALAPVPEPRGQLLVRVRARERTLNEQR